THSAHIYTKYQTDSYCVKLCIVFFLCLVSSPRRLRTKVLSPTKLHVSWKEPKGQFESYKVIYSTRPGGEQKVVQASKQEAKLVIEDFDPSKTYNFKIIAVHEGQESKPLQGKHEAQQSAVEMAPSQGRKNGSVTQENNEISEGKIFNRETGDDPGEQ
uniref:Fibronectin type-III domain-containing protein n=1 Tax=Pundamilia nyererei TaxID=303518 RepID=A0A3B4H880_9CICH